MGCHRGPGTLKSNVREPEKEGGERKAGGKGGEDLGKGGDLGKRVK